jgi:hypothetical protein
MSEASREMSLEEYVGKLHDGHQAKEQYKILVSTLEGLKLTVSNVLNEIKANADTRLNSGE